MPTANKNQQHAGLLLDLSIENYMEIFRLQELLHERRLKKMIPDVVIMLEHTPCFTIGRSGSREHILVDDSILNQHGITVHETSRGGDITYHGPGQLVCYPILSLDENRDLHAYARKMEEVMIRTLAAFEITAGRKPEYPGVWVEDRKIGAMGIAVRKWITMHGISLNVFPDLRHFSFIIPCGITSYGVTSMSEIKSGPIDIKTVRTEMCNQFSRIFNMELQSTTLEQLTGEE
ncbi:lipoyl(octanoyl) transferase LipB [Maridesulfovibrio bastinii]|uniref:lipoyl(octanoyl) transferase LipB n=1 Tax=Maridesulfovibrio bastinii TaxID=47157 RepID=UPI00040A1DFC|nr:lipoyl(octanoyl) transferase LipB [Maridesulfovibrio bastinii]